MKTQFIKHQSIKGRLLPISTKAVSAVVSLFALAGMAEAITIANVTAESNTPSLVRSGFEDGNISPFTECTFRRPAYAAAANFGGRNCIKFYWDAVNYDGTRVDRGIEGCTSFSSFKEVWYSFEMYLPSAGGAGGFPNNKEQAIAQVFQNGSCNSWGAMLIVRNNQLILQHRSYCGVPTEVVIAGDIQRNAWKQVAMHFVASRSGAGKVEVWYAGATSPTYSANNINFGFGSWTGDTLAAGNNMVLKLGLYAYDDTNYTANEQRTLYFDNVTQFNGSNGLALLTGTGGVLANGTYKILNRNSGQSVDVVNFGTANGTNVQQWPYLAGTNQRWVFNHLGNNQYSIIGVGSTKALEIGGNSTANGGNAQIWSYAGTNSQKWAAQPMDPGFYRLTCVNSGKVLEVAGASTANGANIQQWTDSGANHMQWDISTP